MGPRTRSVRLRVLAVLGTALVLPGIVAAQITTGSVAGIVQDEQGGLIPGATVVLVDEARGTRSISVVTGADGTYTFVNVAAGEYTVEVSMTGFSTLRRPGVQVSPGDRVNVPVLTIEVGGTTEVVSVSAEAPLIQAQSGERSFAIESSSVANLPMANRSFAALVELAPGVADADPVRASRVGGGGAANFMLDGISTMDTGSNRLIVAVNTESIAEVKVLTSGYQAEYGRSSGMQITAVTKSGTNRFHGSIYDIERRSDWNANSRTNILNGDPKTPFEQREWGFSVGGPVGKPGGENKIFFFYAQEFQPRVGGGNIVRHRMPTALERAGDFSQSTDNRGEPFNLIRDASTGLPCSADDTSGCFQAGGVLGRIPADRLYQPGLAVLNSFPMPNVEARPGQEYNFQITRPEQRLTSIQPAVRIDVVPFSSLRGSFKYTGWRQPDKIQPGTIPGYNDTKMQRPVVGSIAVTANYTITPTTFLEVTYGTARNEQAGCSLQGAPSFCTTALPMSPSTNRLNNGLEDLPYIFPDAQVINPSYYAYGVFNDVQPAPWDGTRLQMAPNYSWGNRVGSDPPDTPFPGYLNVNSTWDFSASLTKVAGRHTIKAGFYQTHSYKAQQRGNWNGNLDFGQTSNNPLDSGFGFSNAALGVFNAYSQASSYVEGNFVYDNVEGYVQDNWRVNNRLTLDYGVRIVHQAPQYDELLQASNFLPDRWNPAEAPLLYAAGCAGGAVVCSGDTRRAMNPATGEILGAGSALLIGNLVPDSGNPMNGLFLAGQGIPDTVYRYPGIAFAPRFGLAYDLTGTQSMVFRTGGGLFFDRPDGNAVMTSVENPPTYRLIELRYGTLRNLSDAEFAIEGVPNLEVYELDSDLPSSVQWNAGVQMELPWNSALDVSYVGQHGFNELERVDINAVDFGAAFLPENQDPTLGESSTPGGTVVDTDRMRSFQGFGRIRQQWSRGWQTYHSVQVSLQRRFSNGLSFGFNDTISIANRESTGARLQHGADGSYSIRPDQEDADRLLGRTIGARHILKANAVWDLPDLVGDTAGLRVLGYVLNDWQVAGVWTARTGQPYTIGYSYEDGGSSINLTGSPDYGARIRVVGDPGSGCSSNVYAQFNTAAFQGPLPGSVGLESGNDYLRGCFQSALDLSLSRVIRLGGERSLQFRVDVFNLPNAAGITNRNTTIQLTSPNDPVTAVNLPFDENGNLIASRSLPRNAGFGVANGYQAPRSVQAQVRFSF